MAKRKTFSDVRKQAIRETEENYLAEICRIIKHEIVNDEIADRVWQIMSFTEARKNARQTFTAPRSSLGLGHLDGRC